MMIKHVAQLAGLLNVKHYVEGGRFKMEAQYAATLLRVWTAAGGCDYVKQPHKATDVTRSWNIYSGGQYVACVLFDTRTGFAYSYTSN